MNIKNSNLPRRGLSSNDKSLKIKLSDLESKYTEFMNHCSSYIQNPMSPHTQKPQKKPAPRGLSSDISKENNKLRRQNELLSNTISQLNLQISSLNLNISELKASKDLEKILKTKSQLLEKQELEMHQLKKELEKMKIELASSKDRNVEQDRQKTVSSQITKNSKSPLSQRWLPKHRDFSPIDRKNLISPINLNVSPKDRTAHHLKGKIKILEDENEKLREEKNLYRVLQKVSQENPPSSPSVQTVISIYEQELQTVNTFNQILKGNIEKLAKFFKEFVGEVGKGYKGKQGEYLDEVKRKIFDVILDSISLKNKINTVQSNSCKNSEENLNLLQVSQKKLIKEYEDLERIVRREQANSDIALFEISLKSAEINELKTTIENNKFISSSAQVTTENFFDSRGFNKNMASTFSFGNEENRKLLESSEHENWKEPLSQSDSRISAEFKKVVIKVDNFQDKFEGFNRKANNFIEFVDKIKQKIANTQAENKELNLKVKELEIELRGHKELNIEYKNMLEDKMKIKLENESLLKEVKNLQFKVKIAEELRKEMESGIQKNAKEVEIKNMELEIIRMENKKLEERVERQDEIIKRLESVKEDREVRIKPQVANSKLSTIFEYSDSVQSIQSTYQSKLEYLIKSLNESLHTSITISSIADINQILKSHQEHLQNLETTLNSCKSELSLKCSELKSKDSEIELISSKLDLKNSEISDLQDLLLAKDSSISDLNSKLQNLSSDLSSKSSENLSLNSSISSINQTLSQLQESTRSMEDQISSLKSKLLQETTISSSQSNEIENLSNKLASSQEDFTNLQSFYDSLYEEKIKLIEEIESLKENEAKIMNRVLEEQILVQDKEHQIELLTKTIESLEEENKSRTLSEENLRNEKNNEIDLLRTEIKNLEEENDLALRNLVSLEMEIKEHKEKSEKEVKELAEKRGEEIEELIKIKNIEIGEIKDELAKVLNELKQIKASETIPKTTVPVLSQKMTDKLSLDLQDLSEPSNPSKSPSLLSPHNLMRTESLEQMPEIVLEENSSNTSGHQLSGESLQLHLLSRLQDSLSDSPCESVLNWCKQVLGSNNYMLRYDSNDSVYSEESRSNLDEVSMISDSNQELNYRAHAKLMQQKKIIDSLLVKMREKKEKIRLCRLSMKTLQNEIRNLDTRLKNAGSLNIEYLKTSISSFSKNLKSIDNDSLKTLQIIQSQLGIKVENQSQKKWNFFKK